jgi:hypothetical protein
MFGMSSIERKLEDEIEKLLQSAAFDSPGGLKAQSRYLLLQGRISLRTARYTFWTVVILALAFIADVVLRIIQLARCF